MGDGRDVCRSRARGLRRILAGVVAPILPAGIRVVDGIAFDVAKPVER